MKGDKWQQTRKSSSQQRRKQNAQMRHLRRTTQNEDCRNGANSANYPRPKRHNQLERKSHNPVQHTTTKTTDESKN